MNALEQIAQTVLYEGYVLWPYRRPAGTDRRRWTAAGVYPRAFAEAGGAGERWQVQAECLVVGAMPSVDARLRFLQVVERCPARLRPAGDRVFVDALEIDGAQWLAWDEATERSLGAGPVTSAPDAHASAHTDLIVLGREEEEVVGTPRERGVIVRRWSDVHATLELEIARLRGGVHRVRTVVSNGTAWEGRDRDEAARHMLASAHVALRVRGGEFVSMTEPPMELRADAEACEQVGLWPVLVGGEGQRDTMLAAQMAFHDYPRIMPERRHDRPDGTEVGERPVVDGLASPAEAGSGARRLTTPPS